MKTRALVFLLLSLLLFAGCDDEQLDLQTNLETATEYVIGEVAYLDIFDYVDKALQDSLLNTQGYALIDSAMVTLGAGGLSANLDFGSGVQCPDGKYRSGSISVLLTAPYIQDTTSLILSLNSYSVDNRTFLGSIGIDKDFTGINKDMVIEVAGGSFSDSLGNTSTWQSVHTLRWSAGTNTPGDMSDDTYNVLSGSSASGTAYNGQAFSASIT
ncbi:MAG TPA: hypothetical protein P5248_10130, partial [Bacteroidales bacterium]|nr:hypothetical protein [Bacteroidales bacterium]